MGKDEQYITIDLLDFNIDPISSRLRSIFKMKNETANRTTVIYQGLEIFLPSTTENVEGKQKTFTCKQDYIHAM